MFYKFSRGGQIHSWSAGWSSPGCRVGTRITCMIQGLFPGLDLFCTDPGATPHNSRIGYKWSRSWSIWSICLLGQNLLGFSVGYTTAALQVIKTSINKPFRHYDFSFLHFFSFFKYHFYFAAQLVRRGRLYRQRPCVDKINHCTALVTDRAGCLPFSPPPV